MILGFDTTSEFGSIALFHAGAVLDEVLIHAPEGFGHVLYGHLRSFLRRNAVEIKHIERFAAASGPGSFTGVRVGLAAAKGLGLATRKPVLPVSNLQALAYFGSADLRAVVLDARRGEVYGAIYNRKLELIGSEMVGPLPHWLKMLPASPDLEVISTDPDLVRSISDLRIRVVPPALAGAVAILAARMPPCDAAEVDANYIRRSDAELFWKE